MRASSILSASAAIAFASLASAAPNPMITPAPEVARREVAMGKAHAVEERGLIDGLTSLFGSLFSDVGGYVTSEGGHLFTVLSEDGHDAFTLATGAGGVVTSVAGSIFTVATEAAGSIFTEATSIAGHEYTVISEDGHKAFTLATDAAGVVTSVGGSVYTAATGSLPTGTGNSAAGLRPSMAMVSGPVLVSLVTVVSGVFAGASILF